MKVSFGKIITICLLFFAGGGLEAQVIGLDSYPEISPDSSNVDNFSLETTSTLPPLLAGLWENSQRVVSFESLDSAHVVLKLFYGWYYDRAAEPSATRIVESTLNTTQIDYNYSGTSQSDFETLNSVVLKEDVLQSEDLPPRPRNDATSPQAQHLLVEFQPLIPETETSGAWNIWITYPDTKIRQAIPVAVFDGKLYVDFFLAQDLSPARFFQGASNTQAISIAQPLLAKEVTSYLITGSRMYKIRYWETDMEYDKDGYALLSGEDGSYEVPKHLLIGDTVYTCVAGRRVDIRNIEEIPHDLSNFTLSEDNRIVVQKDAYLTKMDESASELYQLIAEANSRKAPPPPPPIPLGDLDFHYDEINDLRKYMIPQPEFPEFEAWEFIKTATHQTF